MKKTLLVILTVMAFTTSFSQPDEKRVNQSLKNRENIKVPENVYYLSMHGGNI